MHDHRTTDLMQRSRTQPTSLGAAVLADGSVRFRVWAPRRRAVRVVLPDAAREVTLLPEDEGYFSVEVKEAGAGTQYAFRLDEDPRVYPDPASRFQPEGPHGPSEVIDPAFDWADEHWPGLTREGQVLYEMHVGTFTADRTYAGVMRELQALKDLGITCIELMPLAEFAGRFGWGYDGVDLFAPSHVYGRPEELRALIDRAHRIGLGVILDVVYNHLGPDGNYLEAFAPEYFTDRYPNEWGRSINFDGRNAAPVREFFVSNAEYWIREYHFDGLRFDATQSIVDRSPRHILAEMAARARAAAGRRQILLIGENEPQDARLVRPPDKGGFGLDALWNDDFHHSVVVAATGRAEAYYSDYHGSPQELISAVRWGYLFQGQRYEWQQQRRGTPALDLPPSAFVTFIENHDQVANSAHGWRLARLTSPGRYRALSALLLLVPATPMLFQGQEFASSKPFLYFADHKPELALQVRRGRIQFLRQLPSMDDARIRERLADPADPETFAACTLDLHEREAHGSVYALYRDLLELRRTDGAFLGQRAGRHLEGAVLGPEALVLRFFDTARNGDAAGSPHGDRLLIVNLGRDRAPGMVPEPLLAPPSGCRWRLRWSSEDAAYGGGGTPPIEDDEGRWRLPGHAAVVLAAWTTEDDDGTFRH